MDVIEIILILTLTIVPTIVLLWLIYKRDFIKPEPPKLVTLTFLTGFLTVIPPLLFGFFLIPVIVMIFPIIITNSLVYILVVSFIFAGLIEEVSKISGFRISSWNFKEFNEIVDGIVYGVAISLGFATVENLIYSQTFYTMGGELEMILVQISLRAVTAVPVHAILGGILGYYLGKAKMISHNYAFSGLLLVIFLHGLYDFLVIGMSFFAFIIGIIGFLIGFLGVIFFLILGIAGLLKLIKKSREQG